MAPFNLTASSNGSDESATRVVSVRLLMLLRAPGVADHFSGFTLVAADAGANRSFSRRHAHLGAVDYTDIFVARRVVENRAVSVLSSLVFYTFPLCSSIYLI